MGLVYGAGEGGCGGWGVVLKGMKQRGGKVRQRTKARERIILTILGFLLKQGSGYDSPWRVLETQKEPPG